MKNVTKVDLKYSANDLKQDPVKVNNQGNQTHIAFVHNPKVRHHHSQSADQQFLHGIQGKININKTDSLKPLLTKNENLESEYPKLNLNTPKKQNGFYDTQNNNNAVEFKSNFESPKNKNRNQIYENPYQEQEETIDSEDSKSLPMAHQTQFSIHRNKIKSKLMDSTILEFSNTTNKKKCRGGGTQSSMNTINSLSTNLKSPKNSAKSLICSSPFTSNGKPSPKVSGLNQTNLTNLQLYKFQKTQPIHKGKLILNHQKRIKHNNSNTYNTYSFLNSNSNSNQTYNRSSLTLASDLNKLNLNNLANSQEHQVPQIFSNRHHSSTLLTTQKEPLLKNRDKIVIRNKRLSLEKEIELPTINYKINKKLRAPEMWQRGQEIKMQVETNLEKHINFKKTYGHYLSSDRSKKDTTVLHTERTVHTKNMSRNSSFSFHNSLTGDSSMIIKSTINEKDLHHPVYDRFSNPFNIASEVAQQRISAFSIRKPLDESEMEKSKFHDPHGAMYDNDFNYNISSNENIQKELEKIRNSQFTHKYDFLNALHKKVQNSFKRKSAEYKNVKDVYSQYKQRKILDKYDYAVSSNLYVMNQNPMFQINNDIAFPVYLEDPNILGNVYDVNMYNLRNLTEKYVQREKELHREMGIGETQNDELLNTMKALESIKNYSLG
jgi:hypothetical protein